MSLDSKSNENVNENCNACKSIKTGIQNKIMHNLREKSLSFNVDCEKNSVV